MRGSVLKWLGEARVFLGKLWEEHRVGFYALMTSSLASACSIMLMVGFPNTPWLMFWASCLMTLSVFVFGFEVLPYWAKRSQDRIDELYFTFQGWIFITCGITFVAIDVFLLWLAMTH